MRPQALLHPAMSRGHITFGLSWDPMIHLRKIALLLGCASFLTFAGGAAGVSINKCAHADGRIEFTDQPCPPSSGSSSANDKLAPAPMGQNSPRPSSEASRAIAGHGLPAEDRLKSCDPNIAIAAAREIVDNAAMLKEPLQLFDPAFAFFQNGRKDEGVFWFYAAQLRVRQQMILERGDRGQLMAIMQMTMGGPINNYAFQDTQNLGRILDRVLEWDRKTPNPFVERARSKNMSGQVDQIYASFGELKSRLVNEKASLEAAARQAAPEMQQVLAQVRGQRCREGQPDPAYENQTRKEEERLALEYVTRNDQVMKLAGPGVKILPASSARYSNDRNKGRYDFSIMGPKPLYAIVDVNRSSGKPVFSLACVTTLSMGRRDEGKDACAQGTMPLPK